MSHKFRECFSQYFFSIVQGGIFELNYTTTHFVLHMKQVWEKFSIIHQNINWLFKPVHFQVGEVASTFYNIPSIPIQQFSRGKTQIKQHHNTFYTPYKTILGKILLYPSELQFSFQTGALSSVQGMVHYTFCIPCETLLGKNPNSNWCTFKWGRLRQHLRISGGGS